MTYCDFCNSNSFQFINDPIFVSHNVCACSIHQFKYCMQYRIPKELILLLFINNLYVCALPLQFIRADNCFMTELVTLTDFYLGPFPALIQRVPILSTMLKRWIVSFEATCYTFVVIASFSPIVGWFFLLCLFFHILLSLCFDANVPSLIPFVLDHSMNSIIFLKVIFDKSMVFSKVVIMT